MRIASTLVVLVLVTLTVLATAPNASAGDTQASCIKFWGETRYGAMAYNHIVHVANSCTVTADCAVSTDVNPEPQQLEVSGQSSVEVMTFMGSPARTFKPNVKCTMRK
jgi:hypothetical protein